jgi:hypothetical protein
MALRSAKLLQQINLGHGGPQLATKLPMLTMAAVSHTLLTLLAQIIGSHLYYLCL